MKSKFLVLLSMILVITNVSVFADTKSEKVIEEFNFIEYLENNEVNSTTELENIILKHSNDKEVIAKVKESIASTPLKSDSKVEKFDVEIDKESNLVYVTELVSSDEMMPATRSVSYTRTGSIEKSVYSAIGIKVYTIKTEGTFQYDKSSYCQVNDAEGFFNSNFMSMWEGNCWISDRDLGATAYVKTYGTATLKISVAQILGINLTFQTADYSLKLICDAYGNMDYEWSNTPN